MRALFSRVSSLTTLGRAYAEAAEDAEEPFATRALTALCVTADVDGEERIDRKSVV